MVNWQLGLLDEYDMIDAIDCYGGEGLVSGLSCGAKIKKKISKKIELGVLKVFLAASVGVARFFGRHNTRNLST